MKRRYLLAVLIISMVSIFLFGCSNQEHEKKEDSNQQASVAESEGKNNERDKNINNKKQKDIKKLDKKNVEKAKKQANAQEESKKADNQEQADDRTNNNDKYLNYNNAYKEAAQEYKYFYNDILSRYYKLLSNQIETDELSYDMIGVFQAYTNQPLIEEINEDTVGVLQDIDPNGSAALWNVGYNIIDVSGDRIPELIIGSVEEEQGGNTYGRNIYALYTLVDKKPQFVVAGTAREKQFYLGNGKFYHNYIGHPLDEFSGIYKLSKDGIGYKYLDYYFTYEKSENSNELRYFHNKVGEPDPEISNELKMSESEFEELLAKISDQIKRIRFIPFYEYSEDSLAEFDSIRIHVDYSTEEELKYAFDYDSFNVEDEDAVKVTFTTNVMVEDFRILELKNGEVDENGKESFVIEEVYGMDVLDPNRPFIVGVHFAGLIPNNGISFTDEDGNTRTFMLYPSGEDGSLILQEVE